MKKVLITGATSLIGVELVKACLLKELEVIALVRKNSSTIARLPDSPKVKVVTADLEDLHQVSSEELSADIFFHLGWQGTSREGRKDPIIQEKNIKYTLDAVELAARANCKVFIGAGSQAEYGKHVEQITTPDSPIMPEEPYGIAKYAAGKLAEIHAKGHGMRFAWVRIFSVYGKYEIPTSMIQTTLHRMLRGSSCNFSAATQSWDFLYGEDAGKAILSIGMSANAEGVYCLGSGKARPLKDYIYEMKEITNTNSELTFSKEPVPMGRGFSVDISKLQKDTGWKPSIDFDEGIQKTIEWIVSQKDDENI
ncbi:MAG: NAD(P)-dependent oxidoreductase [Lachnospiraceae bacterium]|nr:NAD(P)-dependent oxidoreductase [Lachnospiraceae bacterium]